jgi:hypothetical protein
VDARRQKSAQSQGIAFRLGKRRAFVENGIVQPLDTFAGLGPAGAAVSLFFSILHALKKAGDKTLFLTSRIPSSR